MLGPRGWGERERESDMKSVYTRVREPDPAIFKYWGRTTKEDKTDNKIG